jgi:hypothetical protein
LLFPELQNFYSLLLFVPGIAIIDYASVRLQLKLTPLDKVIAGSLLWNLVFVSSASAASLAFSAFGAFSYDFAYTSLAIIILYLIANIKRFMRGLSRLRFETDQTNWIFLLYIAPILIVISFLGIYTTISQEWDVFAIWLPMAKSIASTGGMIYNIFFLGSFNSGSEPPFVPLIYAWTYVCAGGYFRLIPIFYLLLLGGASYKLSIVAFEKKELALTSVVIVLTSLVTLSAFFAFTLDPDLPAAFFLCSAAAYLSAFLKSDSSIRSALLMTMSLSLLILTRDEGLLFAFVCLSLAVLATSVPYKKWISTALFISLFVLWMLRFDNFYALPLLAAYGIAAMVLIVKSVLPSSLTLRRIPLVLAPFIPAIVILWQIGARTGLWAYGLVVSTQFSHVYSELQRIFSAVPTSILGTTPEPTLGALLRLDDIFLRYNFLPLSILLVIGIAAASKRNSIQIRALCLFLIAFLLLALTYPSLFYPSLLLDYSLARRYLYVIPFVAAISAYGLDRMVRFFARSRKQSISSSTYLFSFLIFNAVSLFYLLYRMRDAWPFPLGSMSGLQLLEVPAIDNYTTLLDFVLITAALVISIGIGFLFFSLRQRYASNPARKKIITIVIVLLVVLSSLSTGYPLRRSISETVVQGASLRGHLPPNMGELVSYFNSVPGNGSVIGFQIYFLATFANRPVIDLSLADGLLTFERYFNGTNINSVGSELSAHGVQFVAEPEQGTSGRTIFDEYGRTFPVFDALLNSSYVQLVGTFGNQTVYQINK